MVAADPHFSPSQAGIILELTRQIRPSFFYFNQTLHIFRLSCAKYTKVYSLFSKLMSAAVMAKSEDYFNTL